MGRIEIPAWAANSAGERAIVPAETEPWRAFIAAAGPATRAWLFLTISSSLAMPSASPEASKTATGSAGSRPS